MIIFFDSGVGGLPYLQYFRQNNPSENLIYIADRINFPYGKKTKQEIIHILVSLFETLINQFQPKLVVLACNTASVSALPTLRETFPHIPWIGTVPAIKPALIESHNRCVGVLGTDRTIDDPYITELIEKYREDARIICIPAARMVEFVEKRFFEANDAEKQTIVSPYIKQFRNAGADAVVLGCTHFLFLQTTFRAVAVPDIKIYDSIAGVSHRIEAILDEKNIRDKTGKVPAECRFILTGVAPIEQKWFKWASDLMAEASVLHEKS
ncbi:MAG: glutamate racemase [Treponema sp.]|jgi:glutamate racemase|nr:glutamate racemase [Treponema sp.]